MKIAIIHTSRSRPEIAYDTVVSWLDNVTSNLKITYTLGVEVTEIQQYGPYISKLQDKYGIETFRVRLFSGKRIELAEIHLKNFQFPPEDQLINYLTANTKGTILCNEVDCDWIVTVADNFLPPKGWDQKMLPQLEALKDTVAIIGYQNQLNRKLVSHPVVTKQFIEWNGGFLMYPGYYHTHGDCELFLKGSLANCLHSFPDDLITEHKHSYWGTAPADEMCMLNNSEISYKQADPIWQRRSKEIISKYSKE